MISSSQPTMHAEVLAVLFHATRRIAWVFPITAGSMIQRLGGIPRTAMTLGLIYALGLIAPWSLPASKGKPLPV